MSIDCNGSIPVQCDEGPSQWSRDGWDVNESCVGVVTEVEEGKIEEVDDQEDQRPPEMGADEKEHKAEM